MPRKRKNKKKVFRDFHAFSIGLFTALVALTAFSFILLATGDSLKGFSGITGFVVFDGIPNEVFHVQNAYEYETVTFIVPFKNTDLENIVETHATIEIFDSNNNFLKKIERKETSILPGEMRDIKMNWNANKPHGLYTTRVSLAIEPTKRNVVFAKTFALEKKTLSFENIFINEFELGEEAHLDVLVGNHLTKDVDSAKLTIGIADKNGDIITKLESSKTTISQDRGGNFKTTWDTENIEPGIYNAELVLSYEGKVEREDITIDLREKSPQVFGVGYAINKNPTGNPSTSLYLVASFVVTLIVANVVWLVVFQKKRAHYTQKTLRKTTKRKRKKK